MNNLQYKTHLLLQTRYKVLINLIIYLFIIYIYNILLCEITFIECMKESNVEPIQPQESSVDYVKYLEQEAWKMDKRIESLESELKIYKHEDHVVDRLIQTEKDMEHIKTEIRALKDQIDNNEPKSTSYIIFCNII